MSSAELERWAADFWADTDLGEAFPRSIEQAIALKLPVTVVKLPVVTVRSIARWLERHNRTPQFPPYHRDLMGCLYADGGQGFIFVCGADEPEEQRFTLAHDIAHFLVDYWWPRQHVIEALGPSITDVLDGQRTARPDERACAILARVRLGAHWHLLPRTDPDHDERIAVLEERADTLGLELVAPQACIAEILRRLPRKQCSDTGAVCQSLGAFFGLPPYVFRSAVAAPRRSDTPTFLQDAMRLLRR